MELYFLASSTGSCAGSHASMPAPNESGLALFPAEHCCANALQSPQGALP
jgi:hypothetical protein